MNTVLNTCNMSRDMIGTRVGNLLCTSLVYHISFIPSPLLPHPIASHVFFICFSKLVLPSTSIQFSFSLITADWFIYIPWSIPMKECCFWSTMNKPRCLFPRSSTLPALSFGGGWLGGSEFVPKYNSDCVVSVWSVKGKKDDIDCVVSVWSTKGKKYDIDCVVSVWSTKGKNLLPKSGWRGWWLSVCHMNQKRSHFTMQVRTPSLEFLYCRIDVHLISPPTPPNCPPDFTTHSCPPDFTTHS